MKLDGRSIHIVGSAAPDADAKKLAYAHDLVRKLVTELAKKGAKFVVPFNSEPLLAGSDVGPAITFDWTIVEAVGNAISEGQASPNGISGRVLQSLATSKTDDQIPANRRSLYDSLRNSNAIHLEFAEPGWSAGAYRRNLLAQMGDIMIAVSGGEGTEHLAQVYSSKGKPVIPVDLQLGASQKDGNGGAARLFEKALSDPSNYFSLRDGGSPSELLDRTKTRNAQSPIDTVVSNLLLLLEELQSPRIFYVRLLNDKLPEFEEVDGFFRGVVDPFVQSIGYESFEMGRDKHEYAWMNEAIFSKLHFSSAVFVDVTGLRPNCFVELGYALGNLQKVILSAEASTKVPFDVSPLEFFMWDKSSTTDKLRADLDVHWKRNSDRPGLVNARRA